MNILWLIDIALVFNRKKAHSASMLKILSDTGTIRTPPISNFEERRRNKKSSSFSLRPSLPLVPRRMHKACQTPFETEDDDDDDGCCQKNGERERGWMDVGWKGSKRT